VATLVAIRGHAGRIGKSRSWNRAEQRGSLRLPFICRNSSFHVAGPQLHPARQIDKLVSTAEDTYRDCKEQCEDEGSHY
jgi:hypothetical protein